MILFLCSYFLNACNDQQPTVNKNVTEDSVHKHLESPEEKLALNNGQKWKVDSITKINVNNIQSIVASINNQQNKSLLIYKNSATDLQKGLDKMINECKMEGPDHEALHQWLKPLIEKVQELTKATTEEGAASVVKEIEEQINLYPQYFE
jgi:hypothetical protein